MDGISFLPKPFPQQVAQKCKNQGEIVGQTKSGKYTSTNTHHSKRTTKPRDKLKDYLWIFTQLQMNKSVSDVFVFAPWMPSAVSVYAVATKVNRRWIVAEWRTKKKNTKQNDNISRSLLSRVQCQPYAWKTELIEWKPARRSSRSHQFVECLNIIYHYGIYRLEYSCRGPNVFSV